MEYDNNNRGALFLNETATEENRRPYMSGECEVNGKKMRVSAWKAVAKSSGKKYLSLKFEDLVKSETYKADSNSSTSVTEVNMPL